MRCPEIDDDGRHSPTGCDPCPCNGFTHEEPCWLCDWFEADEADQRISIMHTFILNEGDPVCIGRMSGHLVLVRVDTRILEDINNNFYPELEPYEYYGLEFLDAKKVYCSQSEATYRQILTQWGWDTSDV